MQNIGTLGSRAEARQLLCNSAWLTQRAAAAPICSFFFITTIFLSWIWLECWKRRQSTVNWVMLMITCAGDSQSYSKHWAGLRLLCHVTLLHKQTGYFLIFNNLHGLMHLSMVNKQMWEWWRGGNMTLKNTREAKVRGMWPCNLISCKSTTSPMGT